MSWRWWSVANLQAHSSRLSSKWSGALALATPLTANDSSVVVVVAYVVVRGLSQEVHHSPKHYSPVLFDGPYLFCSIRSFGQPKLPNLTSSDQFPRSPPT